MDGPSRRILVFTPVFPKLNKGAAEQDQLYGALTLQQMGHTVRMAAFLPTHQSPDDARAYATDIGLDVTPLPYPVVRLSLPSIANRIASVACHIALLDGAAYQHYHPTIRTFAAEQIESFQPDVVWLDNDFLWPLALLARQRGIPVIFRSQNFEPDHMIDESGATLFNYLRYLGKYVGELTALQLGTVLVAITPVEQAKYRRLAPRAKIELLPLRGLPRHLRSLRRVSSRQPLNVFYWGSTYNVSHNRAALNFVVRQIAPKLRIAAPHAFCLHVFGGKAPPDLRQDAAADLIFHGFVPDLENALDNMDIALVPSLYGCGMQQKVFEPLCRGFPTVTSRRALAGYPFEIGRDVLLARSADDFVACLLELRDAQGRTELAANASRRAADLFSNEQLVKAHDKILRRALE